jgi:exonuclease 3'-5' domain-containing protein 2
VSKLSHTTDKDRKIYGNCMVYSPDDVLMFRCSLKKANWYLIRDLAIVVSNDPLIVKLNFNPNGLGNHEKGYGLSEINNICVVCGTSEYLTRHHVVPYCYRRYFPIELKAHNFHDVLSMCADCHESYEYKAFELKKEISNKYNVPLDGVLDKNEDLVKAIKYSKAIIFNNEIPKNRMEEMKGRIEGYFGRSLTTEDLVDLSDKSYKAICKTHGEITVSMMNVDEIKDFVKLWRRHFVENNNCKFLPGKWNIDNNF